MGAERWSRRRRGGEADINAAVSNEHGAALDTRMAGRPGVSGREGVKGRRHSHGGGIRRGGEARLVGG